MKLIVATGNPGKLKEMRAYLQGLPVELASKPPELEIAETGSTFAENARLKASQTAMALRQWAIADDSGLSVTSLGGKPGVYSARYGNTDAERIARLLQELRGSDDRSARFICAIALANPQGEIVIETEGVCEGVISETPMGEGGFGYDPIFYIPAAGKTFAQMSVEEKGNYSHRGKAFAQFRPLLQSLLEKA
ncbi:MAG: RdgB/HAM1 family non-canonical purine NTP pyrophosphatase [Geminocystis sp.]|nr:RdgB/HAM1 family non-canonical purine NTP pyrophosphatase [Geminocystis sp.]HIK37908.1 RdgB/HAM1 family non-canonical purine NTP pyrophosphatase [Geminocystis sp. M7585_C2015_104]MCS7147010.1 RdgB/HAM1 family non-canonical purine NTP pyrophosphatase [Geminocystis sp.]MCX8077322.1 RdgB/HAM1 family non-canonical purine NTP pyrophosphatase [Geminocystis sp.]MDW8115834.1 RdgB/HAM1 family non-canonical purine NTP pyrophosphatase [Geminocystis sp.]